MLPQKSRGAQLTLLPCSALQRLQAGLVHGLRIHGAGVEVADLLVDLAVKCGTTFDKIKASNGPFTLAGDTPLKSFDFVTISDI
jgi:hypothetical protein